MCDFKNKYGDYFSKAYSFMEKFHGTASDEKWKAISAAISGLKTKVKFDVNLVVAVTSEIERVYKFARKLFFYSQSPSSEGWNSFVAEMGSIQNPNNFERSIIEVCINEFSLIKIIATLFKMRE